MAVSAIAERPGSRGIQITGKLWKLPKETFLHGPELQVAMVSFK